MPKKNNTSCVKWNKKGILLDAFTIKLILKSISSQNPLPNEDVAFDLL